MLRFHINAVLKLPKATEHLICTKYKYKAQFLPKSEKQRIQNIPMLVTLSVLNNIFHCWIKGSCFYLNLHIVSLFGIVSGCCTCLTHSQPLSYILSTTTPTASIICLLDSDRLGIENRLLQDQLLSPGPYLDLCFSV